MSLLAAISDLDRKIASLVAAVESGAEIAALTDQLTRRSAERVGLQAQLRGENSAERLTVAEMEKALGDLGGHRRDPAEGTTCDEGKALRFVGSAARI